MRFLSAFDVSEDTSCQIALGTTSLAMTSEIHILSTFRKGDVLRVFYSSKKERLFHVEQFRKSSEGDIEIREKSWYLAYFITEEHDPKYNEEQAAWKHDYPHEPAKYFGIAKKGI